MLITVPLYITLFIYLLLLTVFVVFMIVNLYHIIASGTLTVASFAMTFLVFAGTALTLYYTFRLLPDINWQQSITVFNSEWLIALFPF